MKLTLKEARRLERRLEPLTTPDSTKVAAEINIYEPCDVSSVLVSAMKGTEDSIQTLIFLIAARAEIRRAIQIANEEFGINALVSKREAHLRTGHVWTSIVNTSSVRELSADMLTKKIETKTEALKKSTSYYDDEIIHFNTITPLLQSLALINKNTIQRNVDVCDDKLAAKNATVTIDIPTDIEILLKKNDLI